jgi:arylsulfatase A-like enzyme
MLGRILERLEKNGLAANTLVIAAADNGAAKRSYIPLREAKSSIYEGGHREPFVARWPGRIQEGSTYDHTVCLNDFFATCADLLDVPLPSGAAEDSVSLLPCLLGKTSDPVREATVHQSGNGLAIRQGPWKMIFHHDGKRELFNLSDDISETKDLFTANQETSTRLTELMQSYIDRGRSTAGPPRKNEYNLMLWDGKTESKKAHKRRKRKENKDSNPSDK